MKHFLLALAALWLALTVGLSCASRGGGAVPQADCSKVAFDVCNQTPGCLTFTANPLRTMPDPSMTCALPTQAAACASEPFCNSVASPSLVKDSAGKEWVLHSPCLPPGWTQTSTTVTIPDCPVCEFLSLADCARTDYCLTIDGAPIDTSRRCALPSKAVGCRYGLGTCGALPTRFVALSQQEWIVSDSCAPLGWTLSPNENVEVPACAAPDGSGGD